MLYTYAITDLRLGNALIKGIPIPSNELIYLVAGTTEVDWFLQSGRLAAQNISDITFSSFQVNPMLGKLDFEDEKFDFIYALSVFTHLKEPQQFFWMNELLRVIKPGGYLFITVHGERFYLPRLLPEDQIRFLRGDLVVYGGNYEGSNICTAFHPDVYVMARFVDRYQMQIKVTGDQKSLPRG